MSPPRRVRTQDDLRQMEKFWRTQGYSDGYRRAACAVQNIVYAQAWRRGKAQREADDRELA